MRVKEIKIDRKEFNLIVNDILLDVKPIKLRIKIANRLLEHFDNKQEQLQNLEAKLAEKDVELNKWSTEYARAYVNRQNDLIAENVKLKQQLAEKEKEISNLRGLVNERDKQIKNLKTNKKRVIEHKNNVKISFCIEKLTDIRSFVSDATEIKEPDYTKVCNYIDNQIEELKKELK